MMTLKRICDACGKEMKPEIRLTYKVNMEVETKRGPRTKRVTRSLDFCSEACFLKFAKEYLGLVKGKSDTPRLKVGSL